MDALHLTHVGGMLEAGQGGMLEAAKHVWYPYLHRYCSNCPKLQKTAVRRVRILK